jgi:hypothetical protein
MQEGDEIKIKMRSKMKRGTQKCERHPIGKMLKNGPGYGPVFAIACSLRMIAF